MAVKSRIPLDFSKAASQPILHLQSRHNPSTACVSIKLSQLDLDGVYPKCANTLLWGGHPARPNTGLLVSPTPQENAIYALIGMLPFGWSTKTT